MIKTLGPYARAFAHTHHSFRQLPLDQQMELLWDEGTLLAEYHQDANTVELYQLPGGFFCEVCYEPHTDALRTTTCFRSSE